MHRVAAIVSLAVAIASATSACGASDDADPSFVTLGRDGAGTSTTGPATSPTTRPPAAPGTVEIVDFTFSPRDITIAAGDTVTWRNEDPYGHWVVGTEPDVLDSGELGQAQSYDKRFPQPGTYLYYCNIHNYMKGSVTVR